MSLSKNKRKIEVYNAVQKLRRAKPAQIIQKVASAIGEDPESTALKRAIHRDLKSMNQDNIIGVEYFTPGGEPIHPDEEDQHSNLRVEYFVLGPDTSAITGLSLLLEAGGNLLTSSSLGEGITVDDDLNNVGPGHYVISIEVHLAQYIHVAFKTDDRPMNIHVGRNGKKMKSTDFQVSLAESLKGRSIGLLLPHKTVSRIKLNPVQGHCEVSFLKELNQVTVNDHGSSLGTEVESIEQHVIEDLFLGNQDMTIRNPVSNRQNTIVVRKPTDTKLPVKLKLGDSNIFLSQI